MTSASFRVRKASAGFGLWVGFLVGCSGTDGGASRPAEATETGGSASVGVGGASASGGSVGSVSGGTASGGSANGGSAPSAGTANAGGTGGTIAAGGTGATGAAPSDSKGATDPEDNGCDLVIYDGEPGSHPLSSPVLATGWPQTVNTAADTNTTAVYGSFAMNVVLEPQGSCCGTVYWTWTNWDAGPGQPVDGTGYDNIEFWIKIESGLYWNLQFELQDTNGVNSFTGADIHIAEHIEGNNIDGTWRKAKIPVSSFDTNGIDLSTLSSFVIEGDRSVTFDLDQVKFTRESCN